MKQWMKYGIGLLALFLITYSSLYFRKLDEVKAALKDFDEMAFARKYFEEDLTPALSSAIDLNQLFRLLRTDKEQVFKKYAQATAIGNNRYFLVKGTGIVTKINADEVLLLTKDGSGEAEIQIATELIFGNALRDVTGKVHIDSLPGIMEFNSVSSAINKIVRTEVLPPFKEAVQKGDLVQFSGAIKLNKAHLTTRDLTVIPARLRIISK